LVGGSYILFFTSPNFCLKIAFCISEASISCDSRRRRPKETKKKEEHTNENLIEKAQQKKKDEQSGKSDAKL